MKDDKQIKRAIARYVAGLKKVKWLSQHAPIDSALVKSGRVRVFIGETWYAALRAAINAANKIEGSVKYAAEVAMNRAGVIKDANNHDNAVKRVNAEVIAHECAGHAAFHGVITAAAEELNTAWDASSDAALECRMVAVNGDLKIAKKHREYLKLRMDIWRAGWAVRCDIDGVMYVYGIDKKTANEDRLTQRSTHIHGDPNDQHTRKRHPCPPRRRACARAPLPALPRALRACPPV